MYISSLSICGFADSRHKDGAEAVILVHRTESAYLSPTISWTSSKADFNRSIGQLLDVLHFDGMTSFPLVTNVFSVSSTTTRGKSTTNSEREAVLLATMLWLKEFCDEFIFLLIFFL